MSRKGNGFQKFLAVNLGNMTQITQIRIKSLSVEYVASYSVYYSDDGVNWVLGENVSLIFKYYFLCTFNI